MDMLNKLKDNVGGAVDSVVDKVKDGVTAGFCKVAEDRIEELTGKKIEVDCDDIPSDWKNWVMKTGLNSICNEDTWDFLEDSTYNKKKLDLWNERDIEKIILTVKTDVPEDQRGWTVAEVQWEAGSKEFTIQFFPRAGRWESAHAWAEPATSGKRWWILRDEIVFGLQLYQLDGPCFYKSDWLEDFEDVDPDGTLPFSTKKFKRWFQFRHWIIFWYSQAIWGWNYQYTKKPPKNPDGSLFDLDSVLSLPSMPDISMPSITLPSLPDIEMPELPDMPDMPSIEAPSLSAPSLSAPSLGEMPSMPDKKKRPTNRWAAHGFIELKDLQAKADGKTIILSNATVTQFWQNGNHIDNEKEDRKKYELKCTSNEQADSWAKSLFESGVKEGVAGGCCTVA